MPGCALPVKKPRNMAVAGSNGRALIGPVVLLVLVVLIDQATKLWAVSALQLGESVKVIGDFFQFTLVYNIGGAMGTRFGSTTYYLVTSILILAVVLYYLYANRGLPRVTYPLALIAGGAIGNIIDRLRIGKVIDFLDVDFFDISFLGLERWWTFNIADAAISVSIVYLVISLFMHRKDTEEELPEVPEETPDDRAQSI